MSATKKIILIGAGGHAAIVESVLKTTPEYELVGVIDDGVKLGVKVIDAKVIGSCHNLAAFFASGVKYAHITIGDNEIRARISAQLDKIGFNQVTLIHPTAIVDSSVKIGTGTFLAAGSIICARATIASGVIINTAATIDHDCKIENFVHICPGVNLAGEVEVGPQTTVGIGSNVIQQIKIGPQAIIGAGTTIIRDVVAGQKVVGNPGKAI